MFPDVIVLTQLKGAETAHCCFHVQSGGPACYLVHSKDGEWTGSSPTSYSSVSEDATIRISSLQSHYSLDEL